MSPEVWASAVADCLETLLRPHDPACRLNIKLFNSFYFLPRPSLAASLFIVVRVFYLADQWRYPATLVVSYGFDDIARIRSSGLELLIIDFNNKIH